MGNYTDPPCPLELHHFIKNQTLANSVYSTIGVEEYCELVKGGRRRETDGFGNCGEDDSGHGERSPLWVVAGGGRVGFHWRQRFGVDVVVGALVHGGVC